VESETEVRVYVVVTRGATVRVAGDDGMPFCEKPPAHVRFHGPEPVRSTVSVAESPRSMLDPARTDAVGPLIVSDASGDVASPQAFVAVTESVMLPEACAENVIEVPTFDEVMAPDPVRVQVYVMPLTAAFTEAAFELEEGHTDDGTSICGWDGGVQLVRPSNLMFAGRGIPESGVYVSIEVEGVARCTLLTMPLTS